MTLKEWQQQEIDRLQKFLHEWKIANEAYPDDFPEELPEGEWDEQYHQFFA